MANNWVTKFFNALQPTQAAQPVQQQQARPTPPFVTKMPKHDVQPMNLNGAGSVSDSIIYHAQAGIDYTP